MKRRSKPTRRRHAASSWFCRPGRYGRHASRAPRALAVACILGFALGCTLAAAPPAAAESAAPPGDAATPAAAPPAAPPAAQPAPAAGPPAAIEGFRGARFGMTEDQVRQAIRKDFPAAAAKLKVAVNPAEKTTVLAMAARDLLPDTGAAQISYILGYKSKKLIEINIVWTSEGTEESDQAVVGTANSLREYFSANTYKRDTLVTNRQVAEHTIVVFRAMDEQGRMILEVLGGAGAALRKAAKSAKSPPLALELRYVADPMHPDVFRIAKGQF